MLPINSAHCALTLGKGNMSYSYNLPNHVHMFEGKKPHPSQNNDNRNKPHVIGPTIKNLGDQARKINSELQKGEGTNTRSYSQRKPRKEVIGVAGMKLFLEHDAEIVPFKDYNEDGVIGHDKNRPYKGVSEGQVLSFTEGDTKYTAWFTKQGDFKGYFKGKVDGKHEKWSNPLQYSDFDWQGNHERLKTAAYTDGGHYIGDDEYEPSYAFQEVTAEVSAKLVYHFTTAEAIERWNDAVRETETKRNAALGFLVSVITRKMGPFKAILGGGMFSYLLGKLLAPQSVDLDPGGKIVFGTKMQVLRSTSENTIDSGVDMSGRIGSNGVLLKCYTQFQNGEDSKSNVQYGFYGVTPYTNSMHEDMLQLFERHHGENTREYVENPDHGLMNFVIRRTK